MLPVEPRIAMCLTARSLKHAEPAEPDHEQRDAGRDAVDAVEHAAVSRQQAAGVLYTGTAFIGQKKLNVPRSP